MAVTEPRYTKDLDVWVRPTRTNAKKVYRALESFGAPLTNLKVRDLEREGIIFQIGVEPVRIDILTQVDGVDFESALARATLGKYGKRRTRGWRSSGARLNQWWVVRSPSG